MYYKKIDDAFDVMTPDEVAELEAVQASAAPFLSKLSLPAPITNTQFYVGLAKRPNPIITLQDALNALQSRTIPAQLQTILDEAEEGLDPVEAALALVGGGELHRDLPLIDVLAAGFHWQGEDMDGFFRFAATLPR